MTAKLKLNRSLAFKDKQIRGGTSDVHKYEYVIYIEISGSTGKPS